MNATHSSGRLSRGLRGVSLVCALVAQTAFAAPPAIPGMEAGRSVWQGTCELCHAEPASGAPQIGDAKAWTPRIAKGTEVLYTSAIKGFMGAMGDEMPARGGNDSLSDDEIRSAVDYMVAAAGVK